MTKEEIEKLARQYVDSLTSRQRFLIGCNHLNIKLPHGTDIDLELSVANTYLKDIPIDDAIRDKCSGNEEEIARIGKLVQHEIHEIFRRNPPMIEITDYEKEIKETPKGLSESPKRLA